MEQIFKEIFTRYPAGSAPFIHEQYQDWSTTKPLHDLRIAHHMPVVPNTLLKIACLIAAGAEVTITNPDFMHPCQQSLTALSEANIRFAPEMDTLAREDFDIYLDCGATLYSTLGAPKIGAIELTGTGDQLYRQLAPSCPVISIDRTLTKQLETIFGTAVSAMQAITELTQQSLTNTSWLVFGFGKIGRGLAYLCQKNHYAITIVDIDENSRNQARKLGINAIDGHHTDAVHQAIKHADIILTATGGYDVLKAYDSSLFENKILANMGILDEFGPRFAAHTVLNDKKPINFVLPDPTPITYIDPEMYAHNQTALDLLNLNLSNGVHTMNTHFDQQVVNQWCQFHQQTRDEIDRWFIRF